MDFGVVISTYKRKDGLTPQLLTRAINSVLSQDYQNFKIFVIGDKYEDNDEFVSIFEKINNEKVNFENLDIVPEREKYENKWLVWKYGGVTSYNYGIEKSISFGFDYICHLDHDDEWEMSHLSSLKSAIEETNAFWLCTKSQYVNNLVYPKISETVNLIPYYPEPEKIIHSSVCINFKEIPLRYRDVYSDTGVEGLPADADMWVRVSEYLKSINKHGYIVNKITCKHTEEGYERE